LFRQPAFINPDPVAGSHVVMVSKPDVVAGLILEAAKR
jgi:hypothetical protein